jgi:hypothetical protein
MARQRKEGPNLTASERRMLAELDSVRSLVAAGVGKETEAKSTAYRLMLRVFDAKKNAYKPRFNKLLDKLKLKTRAKSNNPLLRLSEYVSGGRMEGARKTRFAQSLAAGLHFGGDPVELAREHGGEGKLIRAWKEDVGLIKTREPKPLDQTDAEPTRIVESDVDDNALRDNETYVAKITIVSAKKNRVYLNRCIRADDWRIGGVAKMVDDFPAQFIEAGDWTPTLPRYAKPCVAELHRRYDLTDGIKLDCCAGAGMFYDLLPGPKLWQDIQRGLDFLKYEGPHVKWIVTNPPWSADTLRPIMRKAFEVGDNVAFLMVIRAGNGLVKTNELVRESGFKLRTELKIPERYMTPTGSLGGQQVTLYHWQRGWTGGCDEDILPLEPKET